MKLIDTVRKSHYQKKQTGRGWVVFDARAPKTEVASFKRMEDANAFLDHKNSDDRGVVDRMKELVQEVVTSCTRIEDGGEKSVDVATFVDELLEMELP